MVATIGIGEGAKLQVESQLNSLGTNFLMVLPGTTTSSGARMGFGSNSKLNSDDVDALRKECDACSYVAAQVRTTDNSFMAIRIGPLQWLAPKLITR